MSPSLVGFRGDGVLVDLLRPSILRLVGGALRRLLVSYKPLAHCFRATNVTRL